MTFNKEFSEGVPVGVTMDDVLDRMEQMQTIWKFVKMFFYKGSCLDKGHKCIAKMFTRNNINQSPVQRKTFPIYTVEAALVSWPPDHSDALHFQIHSCQLNLCSI